MTTNREIRITGVLSTSEIAAGCKSAMRGGGCQWGMAEEAGYAAKWLAMHGLFCPAAFVDVAASRPKLSPPQSLMKLSPRRGFAMQCPVCLGALLSDHLALLTKRGALTSGKCLLARNVKSPLLVAACLSQAKPRCMLLSWNGGGVLLNMDNNNGAAVYGNVHQSFAARVKVQTADGEALAKITKAGRITNANTPSRIVAADKDWKKLITWSAKTMVASSQTSTIKGAGAGLTDND